MAQPRRAAVFPLCATTPNATSSFAFYEDSLEYDAFDAAVAQPALIFQGVRDASVDYRTVEAFAKTRPNVTLLAGRRRSPADRQPAAHLERRPAVPGAHRMMRARAIAVAVVVRDSTVHGAGVSESFGLGVEPRTPELRLRVGSAAPRRRLYRDDAADRDLRRARAGGRGGARQSAGGARGAGDHRFGRSRWRTAAAIARTASTSAIRRTVRSCARRTRRPNARRRRRRVACCCATACRRRSSTRASCGGRTEKPSNVWPGAEDPPFLPSRDDDALPGRTGVDRRDSRGRSLARAARVGFSRRSSARRADRVAQRVGPRRAADARRPAAGPDLRPGSAGGGRPHARVAAHQEHGVRSPRGRATATCSAGHGFGHGVGMCVIGAARLAERGTTRDAILARYFPGLDISGRGSDGDPDRGQTPV